MYIAKDYWSRFVFYKFWTIISSQSTSVPLQSSLHIENLFFNECIKDTYTYLYNYIKSTTVEIKKCIVTILV